MDECEIVVVGAGFAAYCYGTSYNMQASRMSDFVRKAAMLEVPGIGTDTRIACDVESYSYLPLLEEMGYFYNEIRRRL
ncbi:MAG: hypothetical protein CM15mP62_18900 [Rhodospirillaceae bacterium]|nr:MAG: hypothetical protein CM15mP62_18900 [Rhodospirillaceae bacterium]